MLLAIYNKCYRLIFILWAVYSRLLQRSIHIPGSLQYTLRVKYSYSRQSTVDFHSLVFIFLSFYSRLSQLSLYTPDSFSEVHQLSFFHLLTVYNRLSQLSLYIPGSCNRLSQLSLYTPTLQQTFTDFYLIQYMALSTV